MKGKLVRKVPHKNASKIQAVCQDCGTVFYIDRHNNIRCNGETIVLCPWCRDDSKPGFAGRSL